MYKVIQTELSCVAAHAFDPGVAIK
jgi:hypothetical protein